MLLKWRKFGELIQTRSPECRGNSRTSSCKSLISPKAVSTNFCTPEDYDILLNKRDFSLIPFHQPISQHHVITTYFMAHPDLPSTKAKAANIINAPQRGGVPIQPGFYGAPMTPDLYSTQMLSTQLGTPLFHPALFPAVNFPVKRRVIPACHACHLAKAKCDRIEPVCTRCLKNGKECHPHKRAEYRSLQPPPDDGNKLLDTATGTSAKSRTLKQSAELQGDMEKVKSAERKKKKSKSSAVSKVNVKQGSNSLSGKGQINSSVGKDSSSGVNGIESTGDEATDITARLWDVTSSSSHTLLPAPSDTCVFNPLESTSSSSSLIPSVTAEDPFSSPPLGGTSFSPTSELGSVPSLPTLPRSISAGGLSVSSVDLLDLLDDFDDFLDEVKPNADWTTTSEGACNLLVPHVPVTPDLSESKEEADEEVYTPATTRSYPSRFAMSPTAGVSDLCVAGGTLNFVFCSMKNMLIRQFARSVMQPSSGIRSVPYTVLFNHVRKEVSFAHLIGNSDTLTAALQLAREIGTMLQNYESRQQQQQLCGGRQRRAGPLLLLRGGGGSHDGVGQEAGDGCTETAAAETGMGREAMVLALLPREHQQAGARMLRQQRQQQRPQLAGAGGVEGDGVADAFVQAVSLGAFDGVRSDLVAPFQRDLVAMGLHEMVLRPRQRQTQLQTQGEEPTPGAKRKSEVLVQPPRHDASSVFLEEGLEIRRLAETQDLCKGFVDRRPSLTATAGASEQQQQQQGSQDGEEEGEIGVAQFSIRGGVHVTRINDTMRRWVGLEQSELKPLPPDLQEAFGDNMGFPMVPKYSNCRCGISSSLMLSDEMDLARAVESMGLVVAPNTVVDYRNDVTRVVRGKPTPVHVEGKFFTSASCSEFFVKYKVKGPSLGGGGEGVALHTPEDAPTLLSASASTSLTEEPLCGPPSNSTDTALSQTSSSDFLCDDNVGPTMRRLSEELMHLDFLDDFIDGEY